MRVAGHIRSAVTAPAEKQRQHCAQEQQPQRQRQSAAPPKGGVVVQHQRSATSSRSSSSRRGESNANGQPSNNNVVSAPTTTTTTAAAATATTTATRTAAPAIRVSSASMQQQQQQKQQLHQQQQQLTNNIILLRGARNENGQIVIQNKHDIISFINEQQQQQQHAKATVAATLTQLPTTTTVARKSVQTTTAVAPALSSLSSSLSSSCISLVANGSNNSSNGSGSGAKDASSGSTPSNTILLQTPINASQLESVLLQTASLKKQSAAAANSAAVSSLAQERQYLFKTASRSLSTDSNRMGHTESSSSGGGSKAPFVLQTLKRLEKSQSILVIRNSSTSSASVSSACSSSSTSSLSASSVSNIAHASTSTSADRKSVTPSPSLLLPAGSTSSLASSSVPLSTSLSTTQTASLSLSLCSSAAPALTPTTVCVSTNTQTGALTFTRATKSQQTTTKLGNVALNRTTLAAASKNSNTAIASTTTKASVATTTTTYLRLTNATTTVFANNNNSNHVGTINNNNKNASGSNSKGHNSNVVVAVSANNNNGSKIANINNSNNSNNNGMRNALSGAVETQTQLSLADVQLKQERNTASVAANGGTTTTLHHHHHHPHQQHLQLQQQQQQQQQQHQANAPLGNDGEPIKLPDNLESLPRADSFPSQRHRWNTNEEIAAILISFDKHSEWQSKEVKTRPKSGSLLLYSRKKVRYRRDGYCWKKRKDGKTTREDHMKLKVQGTECIYGCYVHSAILPTFHRRCYWLLQNPDIVLVHYLNVPYPDDNKMAVIAPSITLWGDKKEWTKEELVSQLKPMLSTVTSDDDSDSGNDIEISTAETVESIVCQLMEKQRLSRQAALVKQLDCGCGDASCADGKTCSHPVMRRPSLLKSVSEKRVSLSDSYSQSSSGTPNVVVGQKLYSRWSERRMRDANADAHHHHQYAQQQQQHQQQQHHHPQQQTLPQETAIKFQIIPPNNEQQHSAYQQHYRQHGHSSNNHNSSNSNAHQLISARSNLMLQQQQQQHQQQQQQQSNFNQTSSTISSSNHSNQLNLQRFVANQSSNTNNNNNTNNNSQINHRLQIAKTTITASSTAVAAGTAEHGMAKNDAELIGNPNHMSTNSNAHNLNRNIHNNHNGNNSTSSNNCSQLTLTPQQAQQQQAHQQNAINNNGNANFNFSQQQQQQQQLNTSNSATHTTSTQQQQEFYKLQSKQATNDIKMSASQSQSHHPQAQQQQQQQPTTRATLSTVEPMCMSPEHHPSAPLATSQQQQQHLTSSPSMSTSSPASLSAPPSSLSSSPASMASASASTPTAAAATQSSSQSFMDDNVAHHKQSVCSAIDAAHAALDENLISAHATPMGEIDDVEANNADAVEMSSDSDIKQIIDTSNHNNGNGNNQVTEYNSNNNNKNNTSDGCGNIGASSDSATASSVQQQHQLQQQQQQHQNCDAAQQSQQQAHNNTHAIDFATMDMSNGGTGRDGPHQIAENSAHELHDSLSFLNETLDLSQEDIQRTLIANLPFDTTDGKGAAEPHVLSSIDFLSGAQSDDEILVPGVSCEGDDEDADDVFANLDAFDMLVEFPELDLDDKEALSHTVLEQQQQQQQQQQQSQDETAPICASTQVTTGQLNEMSSTHVAALQHTQQYDKKLLSICDFSPEWSYTEGGVKVLVAGPWTADAIYTVLFDARPVPTVLVQEGVLRCYSPAHDVGFASLQVSCDGFIISNAAMFEYKLPLCQEAPFDAASNDCLYKFTLLNRLLSIEEKMQVKTETVKSLFEQQSLFLQTNFEEKLVNYCQHLTKRAWLVNSSSSWGSGYRGMSLLHLAAALGYAKLVCAMLNWRAENPNIVLETEMDALSQDVHGYTPMAWACVRGHLDVANILYKWNHNALKIKNHAQQTPMDIAHCKGHKTLLSEIYRLEHERHKQSRSDSLGSLSLGINKYSLNDIHSKSVNANEHLFDVKDNENVFNTFDALDVQRSHDGVFLRPVAIASNQSPPNSSRFSKRSSVDSGINMDIRTKPGKSFKDITRLQSFEAHDNFNLAVESSLDALTAGNTTNSLLSPSRKMDFALCEVSTGDSSPLPEKDHDDTSTINNDDITDVTINTENDGIVGDSDAKVLTLAEHIIAAMPDRIKNEADELMVLGSPLTEPLNSDSPGLNNGFMDPLDSLPNTHFESFDFNDHSYRYHEVGTPCSSLSPASSGPLQSPASYSILGADPSVSSPSPPPSTKQLTEFLHASSSHQYPFEADFSKLTLTDTEQRELYEAAKCIQKAYRSYKGRQKLEEQNKERTAAIVIQNYYRRYKQYAYYRQMTNAALVIQHGYRSYCRNKRFKKSQSSTSTGIELSNGDSQSSPNSQCLSSFYDHFKHDQQHHDFSSQPSTPKETSPSGPLKRTYSQSTQNQAARKIQQFMRQSRIKLQRERAEKEKLVHQRRAEYLQSLQYRGQQEIVCQPERSELETTELAKTTNNTFTFNLH